MSLLEFKKEKTSSEDDVRAVFEVDVIKCKHMFSDRLMSFSYQQQTRTDTRNWGQRSVAPRPVLLS